MFLFLQRHRKCYICWISGIRKSPSNQWRQQLRHAAIHEFLQAQWGDDFILCNIGLLHLNCGANYLHNYFNNKRLTIAIRRPDFSDYICTYRSDLGGIYEIAWQLFSATLHLHLPNGRPIKFYKNGKRLACRYRRFKSIKLPFEKSTLIGQRSRKTQISHVKVFSCVLSNEDILSGQRKGKSQ
jgi:hypothetical protein